MLEHCLLLRSLIVAAAISSIGATEIAAQSSAAHAHWPQWRGPLGTGAALAGNPPLKWDDATNIKWKVRIPGDGTSTPVVWGDQIFIQTAVPARGESAAPNNQSSPPPQGKGPPPGEKGKGFGPPKGEFGGKGGFGDKGGFGGKGPPPGGKGGKGGFRGPPPSEPYQFILLCLDRVTGQTLWQKVCREEVPHEGFRPGDGSFAASSAMTDGEHVFAFFGSRGLYCYDLAGNLKWEKDLGDQRTRNGFGEGATPALLGNTIVVQWDHEDPGFVVALDKRTGRELWRQPRDEKTVWATPLAVEHAGQGQVILNATNRVRSYDLSTGKQIWECEGLTTNVIPSGIAADGVVYLTSGYEGNKLLAIRLGGQGDITGTSSILWRVDRDTPYTPSPLLSGQRLYYFKSNNAILTCLDIRTGKPHFSAERIGDLGSTVYASPVAAGGHVYLVGRNGTTVVIKDADKLASVATNVLNDPIDASPVVIGNQLFLRSRQNLYCIAEK